MLKDATIIMILGMGTVFTVLVALLVFMSLGGKLAHRYLKPDAVPLPAGGGVPPAAGGAPAEQDQEVAVAVAAAAERDGKAR